MTVIIKTGIRSGRSNKQVLGELSVLTGGNIRHLVLTHGGVQVPDELAYRWLAKTHAPKKPAKPPAPKPVAPAPEPEPVPEVVVKASAEPSVETTPTVEPKPKPKKRKASKKTTTTTTSDEGGQ